MALQGVWDLHSPTTDRIRAPAVEVLATGLPEKPQHCAFLNRKNLFREMVGCVMEETETPTGGGERATERL